MADTERIVVGLTGGTGSGKSSVAAQFAENDVLVIDADQISRQVCEAGSPCLEELVEEFGQDILNDQGELRRKFLGDLVFHDEKKLEKLNAITHKYIVAEIEKILEDSNDDRFIIDAALLFESGLSDICTAIVVVTAEKEMRAERIAKRDGLTMEQAFARINAQQDESFYTSRADFVIYNNGDTSELRLETDLVIDVIFGK